jgi:hypothetical protein
MGSGQRPEKVEELNFCEMKNLNELGVKQAI